MEKKGMTEEQLIKLARNKYNREYRKKNRDTFNAKQRAWRMDHRAKVKEYNKNYWIKKGLELQKKESEETLCKN